VSLQRDVFIIRSNSEEPRFFLTAGQASDAFDASIAGQALSATRNVDTYGKTMSSKAPRLKKK
jgi:hypothetical protein